MKIFCILLLAASGLLVAQTFFPNHFVYPPSDKLLPLFLMDDDGKNLAMSISADGTLTVYRGSVVGKRKISRVQVKDNL